jgi:hypothetical protein
MSEQQPSNNPLDEFSVTLEYTIKEINAMLNVLGKLPFVDAIGPINSIQMQVGPQFEKAKASLDAVLKTSKGANDESSSAA